MLWKGNNVSKFKTIGIIGAMDEEVHKIKEILTDVTITDIASMEFYEGKLYDVDVVIVRSGIGKVNAGICAQILADRFKVSAIINTGIAGSLNADINIGDIVLSTDAIQHDVDAQAFGYEPGVIPRLEESTFVADQELRMVAKQSCETVLSKVHVFEGRVLSGDQFISDKDKKEWLTNQFSGFCTEMEGAAIAQAASLNHIPFLIIRAISDKADNSAEMDYPAFESMAIEHSVMLLKEMINRIHQQ